jgi:hypothetical protein
VKTWLQNMQAISVWLNIKQSIRVSSGQFGTMRTTWESGIRWRQSYLDCVLKHRLGESGPFMGDDDTRDKGSGE